MRDVPLDRPLRPTAPACRDARRRGPLRPARRVGRLVLAVLLAAATLASIATASAGAADVVQPADLDVRPGETATFTTGAPGAIAYTWYRVASPSDRSVYSNFSDGTYRFVATEADDGARFYARFLLDGAFVTTRTATLTVGDGTVAITRQPQDRTVFDSRPVAFEVAARGARPLTYQWQRSADDGATWDDVAGATTPRLAFAARAADDGARYRALVDNPVGDPVASDPARLTVTPLAGTAAPVEHASLEWGVSRIYQGGNPAGNGCNFFSAGKTLDFHEREGDVRIVHRTDAGLISVSPGTKCHASEHGQRVLFTEGTGTANPLTGEATIQWTGSFTANAYSGMVPWYLEDPTLTVAADGSGTLTATAGGRGAEMTDPENPFDVPPREVVVATFPDVEVTADGVVVVPDFAGVDYFPLVDGVRSETSAIPAALKAGDAGWGSWPASFVDFHYETRLSTYWHSSGLSADPDKPPFPFEARFAAAPEVAQLPAVLAGPRANAAAPLVEGRDITFATEIEDATSVRWQRAASATGPWTDVQDAARIEGAATRSLTLREIDASWNNAYVRVRAENAEGAAATDALRVTTKPFQALAFTVQPVDAITIAGSRVELRGRATGHPAPDPAGYGAELSHDGGATWSPLAGVRTDGSDTFVVPDVPRSADGALVRLTARNADGATATSAPARLAVAAATGGPQLAIAPGSGIDPAGATRLTVVGAGFEIPDGPAANLSYALDVGLFERGRWQPGRAGHRDWIATSSDASGGQLYQGRLVSSGGWFSVSLTVPAGVLAPGGIHGIGAFLRLYDSADGTNTFDNRTADAWTPIVLAGQAPAAIVTQPLDAVATAGDAVELTAAATGTPAPALQWQRLDAGAAAWTDLAGETGTVLRLAASAQDDGARFRLVADNALGAPAASDAALLTVKARQQPPVDPEPEPEPDPDPTPQPPAQPTGGPAPTGPSPAQPSRPQAAPSPRPVAVAVPERPVRVSAKRPATVATLTCPRGGAACRVRAPKRVTVAIAGRRYALRVLVPGRPLKAGARAALRVRVPAAAARRLQGRRARIALPVTLGNGDRTTKRMIGITIRG